VKNSNSSRQEEVIREFPQIGRYRIRLLVRPGSREKTLDLREYAVLESYEGFTRRGIRLTDRAQVELLRDILSEVLRDLLL
jgi:hypothetical protein